MSDSHLLLLYIIVITWRQKNGYQYIIGKEFSIILLCTLRATVRLSYN